MLGLNISIYLDENERIDMVGVAVPIIGGGNKASILVRSAKAPGWVKVEGTILQTLKPSLLKTGHS